MPAATRLEAYTWTRLRPLFIALWVGITLLAGVVYSLVVTKDRAADLKAGLKVAGYTVETSLAAQDWDLALGHLRIAADADGLFGLELLTTGNERIAGPLGKRPVGFGAICRSSAEKGLEIRGCMRVLGRNDCFALGLLLALSLGFFLLALRSLRARIQALMGGVARELEEIRARAGAPSYTPDRPAGSPEIAEILWVRRQVEALVLEIRESAKDAAFGRVASSVSHDVRGSINTLDFLLATLPEVPEKKRAAIHGALKRLKEIVDELKAKSMGPREATTIVQPLIPVIERVISDKRIEYRSRESVAIGLDVSGASQHVHTAISETGLFRVLSNLIDNAIEALPGPGEIRIEITAEERWVSISVVDNGRGIPIELLSRLGTRGVTYGKKDGSGLGLHFAKARIESWGGRLAIESALGKGTRIKVLLPAAQHPPATIDRLELPQSGPVVVLDDDPLVHAMWRKRLPRERCEGRTFFFLSEGEFRSWYSAAKNSEDALYLFDYELSPKGQSGLDLIEELGISSKAVLVTARNDDPVVVRRCEALGVRILPKLDASEAVLSVAER